MKMKNTPSVLMLVLALLLAACVPAVPATPLPEESKVLSVFGAYATAIEEPWDGVIHSALQKAQSDGRITYEFTDDIGYAGDMERVLREVAEQKKPDIIFGDAFGNEEAVRRVAKDYPEIAFVFGSGGGPAEPNFSVFDNWIHEPAYLSGMLAGGLTKTNVIGVVGGFPVPEVNRIVNAFIAGAQSVNPEVDVRTSFINSWFDPAAAKEAALAHIEGLPWLGWWLRRRCKITSRASAAGARIGASKYTIVVPSPPGVPLAPNHPLRADGPPAQFGPFSPFLRYATPGVGDKEQRRAKEETMSEERPRHTQEPAEGSDQDVETPGVERASGPKGGGDEEARPGPHTQEPAEGSDEDVENPGAERAG